MQQPAESSADTQPDAVIQPDPGAQPEADAQPDRGARPDAGAPAVPAPREEVTLSEREVQILAFEAKWWKHAGSKEQAVRDSFGLSSTRYYQLLNGLLDNPAALAHDPVLIGRLRRLRFTRARTRRR